MEDVKLASSLPNRLMFFLLKNNFNIYELSFEMERKLDHTRKKQNLTGQQRKRNKYCGAQ